MAQAKILPSNVYVLGHEYIIEAMSERLFKEREAYGDCCNDQKKIRIYCGVAGSVIRDTLLHEILHASWHLLYLSNEGEEKIVSRLATSLVGFFDDPRNAKAKSMIFGKES
jgi:hypothetical protein